MDDKRRSRTSLPTNVSRLARAISTKGLKKTESHAAHAPSLEMLIEENLPSLDPDKLINTFDSKLGLIQKMLRDYQNEGKQRPDGEKRQKKIAAQAASVAGEAKGKNKQFTEEEAYMNERIQRRVRSAGAGASRALSERVHMYRTNAVARAELHERCLMHKKVKAEAEMKALADRSQALDFIRSNRESLQGGAGMRNEGNPTGLFTPCLSRRSSGAPLRPSTAPQIRTGEESFTVEQTCWRDAMPLQWKEFRTPDLSTSPRGAAYGSEGHDAVLPSGGNTMQSEGHTNLQDDKDGQRSASSPYLGKQMALLPAKSALGANASHAASIGADSQQFTDGDGSRRDVVPPHDSGLMCTSAYTDDSSVAAIDRELRLLLTSRPGGGGSPTKRSEFNMQYKVLAAKRERQLIEAKMRKEGLEWARLTQSEQEAKLKAEAEETERRMKEQAQRKMELIYRHRSWLGTCSLASKLWYIADCVKKDREVHPMRELRRRAATTIAEWYKTLLHKRKLMQLVQLQLRLQKLLAPCIAAKRAQVRQRCGERILHFCALHQKGAAESALIAVKRYRQKLVVIQRAWRASLAVRAMQQTLLYNHLSKFENSILAKAQRDATVSEAAGRQHFRRTTTLRKAASSSQPRGDASVVPKRESSSGRKMRQAEVEDPVVDGALGKHLQPLSKEVKQQVVAAALRECRKKFHFQMMAFMHDKAAYLAQKPIDDLRQSLLRDAGLQAPHELTEPQHPVMLVLLPRAQLKQILFNGIQAESARKAHYESDRRARAEAAWIELQVVSGQRQDPGHA
ncbi:hypothetical protein DUNSADRAFT_17006 [Dunaliella salina]|uniref:Uncharacterized protein n=1 Tax=Dunaliella salina TaxID=3046 RepID=A0ABQ7G2J1_DUNSA|nr:hypothetical protein DUNSADRAFT_17006 [Dunaliella salina]|eukprot:KAF5828825.1 hypothetical protein DUNSADRAFT_17006 [Dunaliella salina]